MERMSKGDTERINSKRERLKESHYGKYNFKPQIDPISKVGFVLFVFGEFGCGCARLEAAW